MATYRFEQTFCSQCGKELGPGDHGVSYCSTHLDAQFAERQRLRQNAATAVKKEAQHEPR